MTSAHYSSSSCADLFFVQLGPTSGGPFDERQIQIVALPNNPLFAFNITFPTSSVTWQLLENRKKTNNMKRK